MSSMRIELLLGNRNQLDELVLSKIHANREETLLANQLHGWKDLVFRQVSRTRGIILLSTTV